MYYLLHDIEDHPYYQSLRHRCLHYQFLLKSPLGIRPVAEDLHPQSSAFKFRLVNGQQSGSAFMMFK